MGGKIVNHTEKIFLEKLMNSSYSNTTGLIVQKNGEILYENYFKGYNFDSHIHVASVTKSIVSALLGIALDKGYIESVDQKVIDFFPDYKIPKDEKGILEIKIKHLLNMTAPYKYKIEPYEEFFKSDNWINNALSFLGGRKVTGQFTYSAIIGTHILSGILVKATKQSLLDFARKYLFEPLEIKVKNSVVLHSKEEQLAFFNENPISGWVSDEQGFHTAGWGLTLTTFDLVKIGQLYLDCGRWNNKQVVPEWWVDESTKQHSQWKNLSYGYLWWILDENDRSFAALGDGGNVIYVNRNKNMVIASTGYFKENAKDRIKLIEEYIVPMFE